MRLNQDEIGPDKVNAVMLRLMSKSGLMEAQVIESFLSTICSQNKFASHLSQDHPMISQSEQLQNRDRSVVA